NTIGFLPHAHAIVQIRLGNIQASDVNAYYTNRMNIGFSLLHRAHSYGQPWAHTCSHSMNMHSY
ncbi:MAG: hypothetical protein MJE68_05155, partial [Proteobacteria bacterium]|nr:hypothetical protein [Pseudomonadota bacterium]